jgi:hypothetical protein
MPSKLRFFTAAATSAAEERTRSLFRVAHRVDKVGLRGGAPQRRPPTDALCPHRRYLRSGKFLRGD